MRLRLRHRSWAKFSAGWSTTALAGLLLVTTAVASQGPTQLKPGFNLFTKQQDVQLGRRLAAKIRKKVTLVNDPTLNAYVNAVGRRLVDSQEARESGFTSPSKLWLIRRSTPTRCPAVPCSSTLAC